MNLTVINHCEICGGYYPRDKHNFEECYTTDPDWDFIINDTTPKPCLKWVGGKTQLLSHIKTPLLNTSFDTYYEPFVGGGSMLLMIISMMEKKQIHLKKIMVSDINWQLICLYNFIKNNPYELMNEIDRLYESYNTANVIKYEKRHKCNLTTLENAISHGKMYVYYYFRKQYNEIKTPCITIAALFIILNKLCFRGLYRSGENGFNTPYGNYINPGIYDRKNIIKMSYLFNLYNVIFECQSYEKVNPIDTDLIYMDPPYYPIRKKAFESYSKYGFDHDKLISFTKKCDNFIQSNAWCEFVVNKYIEYHCEKILCKRRINSKKPDDSDYEIMIFSKSLQRK